MGIRASQESATPGSQPYIQYKISRAGLPVTLNALSAGKTVNLL